MKQVGYKRNEITNEQIRLDEIQDMLNKLEP